MMTIIQDAAISIAVTEILGDHRNSLANLKRNPPINDPDVRSIDARELADDAILSLISEHDVHIVPLRDLRPADSPRLAGEDENHTRRLVEVETELPPILVHRGTMRVIDGMHRVRAAMTAGRMEIRARFFDGDTEEAFLHAVSENVSHGLPLTLDDRRAAARRIVANCPLLSDRAIARYTGLSDKTIGAIRERSSAEIGQSSKRIGIDGRARPLTTSDGRRRAAELMAANPGASLREVAARTGISVGTAHDVRKRMQQGEDPVHSRSPAARPARGPAGAVPAQLMATRRPSRDITDFDPGSLLASLVQDPSIRQTESGRDLLRWLHGHVVQGADVDQVIEAVPAHRIDCMISLAEHCAGVWSRIAVLLVAERNLRGRTGAA